jgi:hypothetical protein
MTTGRNLRIGEAAFGGDVLTLALSAAFRAIAVVLVLGPILLG